MKTRDRITIDIAILEINLTSAVRRLDRSWRRWADLRSSYSKRVRPNSIQWRLIGAIIWYIETHIWVGKNIEDKFACGDVNVMLNDCKYMYTMYRRYRMLNLVFILICLSVIILTYVWNDIFCKCHSHIVGLIAIFRNCWFFKVI